MPAETAVPLRYYRSQAELAPRLGMVVPSWFPPEHDIGDAAAVLATALADLETVLTPANCLVVCDGSAVAVTAARRLDGGFEVLELDDGPHGKGGAVGQGLRRLLERDLDWFIVRDHDGDHFLCDTPRLVRLGLQMREVSQLVLVNGGRSRPARPMGWLREQYERLVNEVVWRGLHHHAARAGRAVDEAWLLPGEPVPDLQSGYKCCSRAAAERVAAAYAAADWTARRWGCEVVATVEVVSAGGAFGEVQRSALDHQPLTTYEGGADRARLHADIVLDAVARLSLPADAVLTWFDAAVARGELRCAWEQREPIAAMRRHLSERLGSDLPAREAPWLC